MINSDESEEKVLDVARSNGLDSLNPYNRHRLRSGIASSLGDKKAEKWINLIVPKKKGNRITIFKTLPHTTSRISEVLLKALASINGGKIEDTTSKDWWSIEKVVKSIEYIKLRYPKTTSCATAMDYLRSYLRDMMVDEHIVKHATDTSIYMQQNKLRLIAVSKAKVDWIDRFRSIEAIEERVKGYLAADPFPCNAEVYADFLVVFSARSSEGLHLYSSESGKLKGALKQTRSDIIEEHEIASCLDDSLALQFLRSWEQIQLEKRLAAQMELKKLVKSWGIRIKDIRVYGPELAISRIAKERTLTQFEAKQIRMRALRHKPTITTTDHYMTMPYDSGRTSSNSQKTSEEAKAKAIDELDQILSSLSI